MRAPAGLHASHHAASSLCPCDTRRKERKQERKKRGVNTWGSHTGVIRAGGQLWWH
jgi:hypothetical protein